MSIIPDDDDLDELDEDDGNADQDDDEDEEDDLDDEETCLTCGADEQTCASDCKVDPCCCDYAAPWGKFVDDVVDPDEDEDDD